MAHHASAKKRIRQSEKRREQNKGQVSKLRTLTKKLLEKKEAISNKKEVESTISAIDKSANKKLIHKNKASRLKSRIARHVNKVNTAK
ncbi:MAG: 30S ribosomal protein S20 [Ignavibacteriales bacterium]|nr:30S ribosomal protein S20 [Ignavibacteriales bacterium]